MRNFVVFLLSAYSLSAATQVQTLSTLNFDLLNTNLNGRGTGSGETLTFAQFNPGLGTLNSVSILIESYMKAEIIMTNNEAITNNASYGFQSTPQVTATGQDVNYLNQASLFPIAPVNIAILSGGTFDTGLLYDSTSNSNVNPANLVPYIGLGSLNYLTTPTASFSNICGGDCQITNFSRYGVRMTLTYDYTADETGVPEPSTNALMGAGLLVIGLVSRKFAR